jgi:hypothetical protein
LQTNHMAPLSPIDKAKKNLELVRQLVRTVELWA